MERLEKVTKECKDKVEEVRKEVHEYIKKWRETKAKIIKLKDKAEERLEKERKSWK